MLLASVLTDPARRPVVLIVEDHEDTRQMYAEFLGASFEMQTAPDAEAALRAVAARPPDVIVTDLSLPGMDGFELVRRLRSQPATSAVPIICLSGFESSTHEAKALAAGCDRLLQKPCMPDALAEVIAGVLGDPSARRAKS